MRTLRVAMTIIGLVGMLSIFSATSAFAAPPDPNAFVCPVLGGQAGDAHGQSNPEPIVTIGGGDASVIGPSVSVPVHATNQNGAGNPGSAAHADPGDPNYSPIWYTP